MRPFGKKEKRLEPRVVSDFDILDIFAEHNENLHLFNAPQNEKKIALSIRLDPEIVDYFKEQGKGYQSRINAVLLDYVHAHVR